MSAHLKLCPFIEAASVMADFAAAQDAAASPAGSQYLYWPASGIVNPSFLICPSNSDIVPVINSDGTYARNNYHFSYGDVAGGVRQRPDTLYLGLNGTSPENSNDRLFYTGHVGFMDTRNTPTDAPCPRGFLNSSGQLKGLESITDGTSNTIAASERVGIPGPEANDHQQNLKMGALDVTVADNAHWGWTGSNGANTLLDALLPTRQHVLNAVAASRASTYWTTARNSPGKQWANGDPTVNGISMVMPPNSVAIMGANTSTRCLTLAAPSSNHTHGVNCAFADGSVHFITDTVNALSSGIDTTIAGGTTSYSDSSVILKTYETGGESKWGVWGALGAACDGQAVMIP
jgi:hypothetical protein